MSSVLRPLFLAAALGLAATAAGAAQTIGYSRAAQRVLAQARQATGGAAWNRLRGWHETGTEGGVHYEAWADPLRYGLRVEAHQPDGLDVHGFNGAGEWRIRADGAVTGIDVRTHTSATRAEAFFDVYGFFYPGRFDASADFVGVHNAGGHAFDVVRVKPWGGAARELWFDRRTHLMGRMVELGGQKPVALEVSDYRKIGGIRVPFRIAPADPAAGGETRQIDTLDFRLADRAIFSLPRAKAETPPFNAPGSP